MKRKLKRFYCWMKQDMPTADQVIVYLCILLIIGSFGAWEQEHISMRRMWIQISFLAGIGYLFGLLGWREVADFIVKQAQTKKYAHRWQPADVSKRCTNNISPTR